MEPEKISARGSLWCAALEYYQREGVEPLCLKLQDEWGLDVPCLLALAWAINSGRSLALPVLPLLAEAIAFAREHVYPLREQRRRARDAGSEAFYESLKSAELAGERHQLSLLEEALKGLSVMALHDAPESHLKRVFAGYAQELNVPPACETQLNELAQRLSSL